MTSTFAVPPMPSAKAAAPGWLPPFAAAALVWNLMAVLGALANFGDAQPGVPHSSLALTLLRFIGLYFPMTMFSLALAVGFDRAAAGRPALARLALVYAALLLALVPALSIWQGATMSVIRGTPMAAPLDLLKQQGALSCWFNALLLTLAFVAHMAYGAWRQGQAQALAGQLARQGNLALRLRLLQGQLEPWLLSSTLAGIARLNREGLREQATRALARLSDLLRYVLRASRSDWQSMADEVQFLRDYVDLRRLCHGAAVHVDWQLEAGDWSDCRCPPLLLFPLLEQALDAPAQRLGVRIALQPAAGRVLVEVSYPHGANAGKGDALAATRERLAMLYGGAAALTMQASGELTHLSLAYPVSRHDD